MVYSLMEVDIINLLSLPIRHHKANRVFVPALTRLMRSEGGESNEAQR